MEWPTSKNVSKIRSFMGLVGYYWRLMKDLSKIGHLIIVLRKKGKKFEWTVECATTFDQLKYFLTNAPILRIIDQDKYLVVCIDAYKECNTLLPDPPK